MGLERVLVIGLFLAIGLAPWLFGAVEPWAFHLLMAILLILWLLWGIAAVRERALRVHATAVHGSLLLLVFVAAIQSGTSASPHVADTSEEHATASQVFGESSSGGESPDRTKEGRVRPFASYDPAGTRHAMWRLILLLGYFSLAIELLRSPRRMAAAALLLMLTGFSLALVGMIQKFAGNGRLLWIRQVEAEAIAFGPFVNRNHAAGFLEMALPLPVALIVARGVARSKWGICGLLAIVMGMALLVTGSRGGTLVLVVELLVLPALWWKMRARAMDSPQEDSREVPSQVQARWSALDIGTVALIVGGILAGLLWVGTEPIASRLSETRALLKNGLHSTGETGGASADFLGIPHDPVSRPMIWKATLQMIRDHIGWGVGLGAYPIAYTRYDPSFGVSRVEHAHNDYLHLLAEAGMWGCLALVLLVRSVWRTLRRALTHPTPSGRALALGATVAILGMGIHSAFDFPLQVTANALSFLLLVALAHNLGHSASCREHEKLSSGVPPGTFPLGRVLSEEKAL